jgi:hypothetical protein
METGNPLGLYRHGTDLRNGNGQANASFQSQIPEDTV